MIVVVFFVGLIRSSYIFFVVFAFFFCSCIIRFCFYGTQIDIIILILVLDLPPLRYYCRCCTYYQCCLLPYHGAGGSNVAKLKHLVLSVVRNIHSLSISAHFSSVAAITECLYNIDYSSVPE
jgi:hypothetical protein